ncbi:MAG: DUF5989 family protein [Planctomycetota bacterium]
MGDFRRFLHQHRVLWIGPIVMFWLLMFLIAWKVAAVPLAPFIYQLF